MLDSHKILYSIPEASAALSLGRTKIYTEIKEGRLRALKSGRRTLITAEAIQEYIASLPALKS